MILKRISALILVSILIFVNACKHDEDALSTEELIANSNYPEEIGRIMINKCATAGCHDNISNAAAAGLNLMTWTDLFKGGNGGAVVIPFRGDQSTLLYYVNHDSILSLPSLTPTMPVNGEKLTQEEITALYNWIQKGAPDKSGFVKFSNNPLRKKYYVTNQGCDFVTVFDAETNLAMRIVDVGTTPVIESPHMIRVAPDNLSWFVCFIGGGYFQQFSTIDNSLIGQVYIGPAQWNTFALSSDGQKAYIIDFGIGKIAIVNIPNMTAQIVGGFGNPHGSILNASDDTLYVTAQLQSYLFKIPVNDMVNYETIQLRQSFYSPAAELQPHDVIFSPDNSKYFVSCDESNEVRVLQTSNDVVIAAIPVDLYPQEFGISLTKPYLFVTCMDAIGSTPSQRGSVAIINYETNQLIKTVYTGYQPHGIAVDDVNNKVYVANRNANPNGPAPHHSSTCGGRNGYVSIIDMNTLNLIPGSNTEVSVDPYSIGITH